MPSTKTSPPALGNVIAISGNIADVTWLVNTGTIHETVPVVAWVATANDGDTRIEPALLVQGEVLTATQTRAIYGADSITARYNG
ncbi:hypothetical protein [Streptomyces sp. NPDC019208]|uniref:hypothetical protein n=1 Tax=Streptomyces sp. NPDC019208 TaxID=3154683 RepID=UPI0033C04742